MRAETILIYWEAQHAPLIFRLVIQNASKPTSRKTILEQWAKHVGKPSSKTATKLEIA